MVFVILTCEKLAEQTLTWVIHKMLKMIFSTLLFIAPNIRTDTETHTKKKKQKHIIYYIERDQMLQLSHQKLEF